MTEEQQSSQERTEKPTPRRRERAREEGRVARSPELSAAFVLLGGTAALAALGGRAIADHLAELVRETSYLIASDPLTVPAGVGLLRRVVSGTLLALVPFAVGVLAVVLLANLVQARGVVSWIPLAPKLSRISPITGIKRILGWDAVANLVKSVFKILTLGLMTYAIISHSWPELVSLAEIGASASLVVLKTLAFKLAATTGLAFLALSAADYAYQYYKLEKSLRMTKQEVIREHRETEGDPAIKTRLRSIAMSLARKRMMQQVPTADVVVVNPTQIAVALKYDTAIAFAPIVVAMGQRIIAERIKQLALESGVTVIENKPVARALLATATVGQPIPPALYAVVAEILAFVYRRRAGLPTARRMPGREVR